MDKFWQHLDSVTSQMKHLVPLAYNKLLIYEWANSLGHLIIGGIWLILCLISYVVIVKPLSKKLYTLQQDGPEEWLIPNVIMWIVFIGSIIPGIVTIFNIWNWVGVFLPEARIIHDILSSVSDK